MTGKPLQVPDERVRVHNATMCAQQATDPRYLDVLHQ